MADVGTTIYAREHMRGRELNPLARNLAVFIPVKVAAIAVVWWLGEKYERAPAWLTFAAIGCGEAAWNGAQIGRSR